MTLIFELDGHTPNRLLYGTTKVVGNLAYITLLLRDAASISWVANTIINDLLKR